MELYAPPTPMQLLHELLGPLRCINSHTDKPSIYSRLKPFFGKDDQSLDPCPVLNSILTDLVSHLQGSMLAPTKLSSDSFFFIQKDMCDKIDINIDLQTRANQIRDVATRAESRMELFYAQRMLASSTHIQSSMSALNRIREASKGFPYTENYVEMVQKESSVLRRLIGEHGLAQKEASVEDESDTSNGEKIIAFCGSGPLPLTGVLLTALMNARVVLIDHDEEAVAVSRKLIQWWEQHNVIGKNRIQVVCQDGAKLWFCKPRGKVRQAEQAFVECDMLFVAALIPGTVTERMFERVAEMKDEGPIVAVRTAHGLTARLAYFGSRRRRLRRYLKFVEVIVPRTHVGGDGVVADEEENVKEMFGESILNSLEVYKWSG